MSTEAGRDLKRTALLALLLLAAPAAALDEACSFPLGCTGNIGVAGMCGFPDETIETGAGCNLVKNCQEPVLGEPRIEVDPIVVTGGSPQVKVHRASYSAPSCRRAT